MSELAPLPALLAAPIDWLRAETLHGLSSRAELIGALLGLAMVVCNIRVHAAAWPLALLSSALYGLVFWNDRLYGSAALQLLFIVVAGLGWWQWLHGRETDGQALRVRWLTLRQRLAALLALALLWPLLALGLHHGTDSGAAWLDAFVTAGSVVAQVLLVRKRVEHWWGWVAVNAVAIGLFLQQGLLLSAGLYGLFLGMALLGLRAWARQAGARA